MVDGFIENNTFQDNPYTITEPDTLGVLSSTRWVVEHASHAWINKEQVGHVCLQLLAKYTPTIEPVWYDRFHFFDGTERTVNWILVLDALNFCFWAEKGQPRWTVEYHGTTLNGYLAEAAALTRAVEEQLPLWDAEYLSMMSENDVARIFRGRQCIPLFEQRLYSVREGDRILRGRYGGQI